MNERLTLSVLAQGLIAAAYVSVAAASGDAHGNAFAPWARATRLDAENLAALGTLIGDRRVVAFTEGVHAAAEPLEYRNRVFRYLIEQKGFTVIAIESGVLESRIVNEYVKGGSGTLDDVLSRGITWSFDQLPQNQELISWLRNYNVDPEHSRKVSFYGFDLSGSPGNPAARSGMSMALMQTLQYLERVDPQSAASIRSRLGNLLQDLRFDFQRPRNAPGYDRLSQAQRNAITGVIADCVELLERRRAAYATASSQTDYDWAYRAAHEAQHADQWLRQVPLNWVPLARAKPINYYSETLRFMSQAGDVRDREQAKNLEWIMNREGPQAKVLVFAHLYHLSNAPMTSLWISDAGVKERVQATAGTYLKDDLGDELITIGNLIGTGTVACEGFSQTLPAAPTGSWEQIAGEVGASRYYLDLRRAPPAIRSFLGETRGVGRGEDSFRVALGHAFDVLFYLDRVSPACPH